jgi:cellulose synthase/poly-beta-1,6-N-acetylglucosamine synthase-like glycosyltransferase
MNGTTWWGILLLLWGGLCSLLWIYVQVKTLWMFRNITWSIEWTTGIPTTLPMLSVIIPACNEEDHLEEALQSILSQDYPELQIILVNDRSCDGTLAIMHRLASSDSRIEVLDIKELPPDWLGKVHALHRGLQQARGELVLFTDADVHFEAGFLRKTVAYLMENELDHLTVGPEARTNSFWQEATNNYFGGIFFLGLNVADLQRPGGDAYAGIGAFNLVRNSALKKTPGFEWLRMEILDDVGLGLMLKRAGARTGFMIGFTELWLAWYPSIGAMARGLEKNMFGAICRFSYLRLALVTVVSVLVLFGPMVALFQPFAVWTRLLGAGAMIASAVSSLYFHRRSGRHWWPLFLAPAAGLILLGILIRSGWKCFRRGGIEWRGTFYPVDRLKAGQRVRI